MNNTAIGVDGCSIKNRKLDSTIRSVKVFFIIFFLLEGTTTAQTYAPTFESLQKRPVPSWFQDAKIGIFIHWGPYSVPAWSPKGSYAEWYQVSLNKRHTGGNVKPGSKEVWQHHAEVYGPHFSYYQFGDMLKADEYHPEEWARLFENAGAKYIVITAKHHDGFCLWPSTEADRAWGFSWNSKTTGARRDLIGELKKAVEKTSLKFGLYYSLYEWYNPLYKKENKSEYVEQHMLPQMRELVTNYEPSVFWTDGAWDHSSEVWKSREFLAWLYSSSAVKNDVVTNNRWGNETDKKDDTKKYLGDFISTEYDGVVDLKRPWEECRGLGYSFGYNRNEDAEDYTSAQALVLSLIDIVSHGGNLLLDIGPDASGKIPAIMQDRLSQMGNWLKINGEAIYGTRKWKEPVQWGMGRRVNGVEYKAEKKMTYLGGDFILKQTVNPDSGYAVKQIFFTQKNNNLYAIVPQWPVNRKVVIRDFNLKNGHVIMLETGQHLKWKNIGNHIEVMLPEFDPDKFKSKFAFVLKITGV